MTLLAHFGHSQYPPPATNLTIVRSPVDGNITVSFKTPPIGTCTTVFPSQKQYTGYVTLPPYVLAPYQQNYTINTFFWFVEARNNPAIAPLTIYINGGPGSSSMVGMFQETGPCEVVEIGRDQLGTKVRDWGWDRSSNVLYIDQPNQVGFSYDTATNGTMDLLSVEITPPEDGAENPSYSVLNGTFSSNDPGRTANTTQIAAHAVWHMLQGFLGIFPQYNPGTRPNSTQPGIVGVNLFTESYGGKYGPSFAKLWEELNLARLNGSLPKNKTLEIRLTSLGIIQGCVDDLIQGEYYPIFSNNNTYSIQALSLVDEQTAANSYLSADGCQQRIQACRDAVRSTDASDEGDVDSVNQICQDAQSACNEDVVGPFQNSGRDVYDITQMNPNPFPSGTYAEYLNTAAVQEAIGTVVNYTESNNAVWSAFSSTGDYDRGDQIFDMSYLLSLGIRVALIYGDRDYICNWVGGEAVSFAIAAQSPEMAPFYTAGYAKIVTNNTYVGGVVRQFGNLSFSRIYDAGHLVPAYQPETAFTVFTRVIMGTDISMGEPVDLSKYVSEGDANSTYQNEMPEPYPPMCWIRSANRTCTEDQKSSIQNGEGFVINGVLYDQESDWQMPAPSVLQNAGVPGSVPSSMTATMAPSSGTPVAPTSTHDYPTGVYVATGTPSPTNGANEMRSQRLSTLIIPLVAMMLGMR